MPKYFYKVKDKNGSIKTGSQFSKGEHELAQDLTDKGYTVILVKEFKDKKIKNMSFDFGKISLVDKIVFTRNLSVMIKAGLSLSDSLGILSGQTKSEKFKKIIGEIQKDIQKGEQLGDSMAKHKKVFSELYTNMIKVGETAGNLQEVLLNLAIQLKKDHDIISRVKGALIYPGVIFTAMFLVGGLMMTIVVPSLAKTFEDLGAELPASTQFIINLSDFLVDFWYIAIIIFIGFLYLFKVVIKTQDGQKIFDNFLLKTPVFGKLSRELNSARFARTLSSLVDSGVSLVDSLNILSTTLTNYYFSESLKQAAKDIQKGRSLNEILSEYEDIYPTLVIQMIKVGEETGALTDILVQLADFYEEEVENVTKNLSTIIEPVLMIFIGAGVGFFAISMITPMYSMLDSI